MRPSCLAFLYLVALQFCLLPSGSTQSFTNSNLPIVLIRTDIDPITKLPAEIPDDPKILGSMQVIQRPDGSRNYLSDQNIPEFLHYNGRIAIELRGSTSQALPKKPYGLTTLKADNKSNNKVALFGMPAENDWVLNAMAFDPSYIRDYLSYDLARSIGNYASRGQFCEVVVNGDYKGLYVFMEKIKIEQGRVNIQKLTASDNALPNVTGGFITKADKTTGGDPVAWTTLSATPDTVMYIHDSPKPTAITAAQHQYIFSQFRALELAMAQNNGSLVTGFPALIDIPSFIDFMLLNELASNVDGYQYSTFFHKDRNGKLRAGPIWDFNLTYGNDLFAWGFNRSYPNVWQFDNMDNTGSFFWKALFDHPTFKCHLAKRWNALNTPTTGPLHMTTVHAKIDKLAVLIAEGITRDKERWGIPGDHANQISGIKFWIQNRINWLNTALANFQACETVSIPALVISKIHYNPMAANGFTSDQLEYLEITNTRPEIANLTGVYFKDLGITFQFPAHTTIGAHEKIYLASNAAAFQQFYGIQPFGQFTRNLSNAAQRLVLSDAYGNIIDEVEYQDATPWPKEADGTGAFLELRDLQLDNTLASSWSASNSVSSSRDVIAENAIQLYPNPVQTECYVRSPNHAILSWTLRNSLGEQVRSADRIQAKQITVSLHGLPTNLFWLQLWLANGQQITKKIVKQP